MTEHTPRQWKVLGEGYSTQWIMVGTPTYVFAFVAPIDDCPALIAAAPDMLAACKMALDCQANCSGVCLSCTAILRAAIAKAKGDVTTLDNHTATV